MCDSKVFQAILHRQSDLNISDIHFTYVNYFHVLISSECFVERLKSSICQGTSRKLKHSRDLCLTTN